MSASDTANHLELQTQLAAHLRNPDVMPAPAALNEQRLAVYRELFFNNVKGFLDTTFPVCAEMLGEARWRELSRDFLAHYRAQSPYFLEIPREFLTFLETQYQPGHDDPLYLYELAHYEWLELAVDIAEEDAQPRQNAVQTPASENDLAVAMPLLNIAEGFLYQYPVHEISLQNKQPEPKPTALIVYRTQDDVVRFIETNPFTLQLLALLKEQRLNGHDAVCHLLQQAGIECTAAALNGGMAILAQWSELGLIAGVIPQAEKQN